MKSNAVRKPVITDQQIQNLLVMRQSLDAMKKRTELLENSVKAGEQALVRLIEDGAEVLSNNTIKIRISERRHPSWKAHYAEVAGADAAENVLQATPPTIYKTLVIK